MTRKIAIVILLCLAAPFLYAGNGENLTIKIAVIGPGNELYFWWGHIALMIDDSVTGRSRFYDYGLFSFENENFFVNFALGRLLYSCGVSPTDRNIATYINTNRDIVLYTLDLPPEKREEIREFAEANILPENRDYYYHHFRDNCCNRIRDIIDMATDGSFYEQYGSESGRFTLRGHVRRHTWFSPIIDWALNFWMGQNIDLPTTVWEEMFLPSEVGKRIEDYYYTDANGERRKLVSDIETVYRAVGRPPVLEVPLRQWPRELGFSLGASAVMCFFFFLQAWNYRAGRILAGLSQSLAGLVFGVAGLMLYFLVLCTNHDYTYSNINMLFGTPLLLAAVPLGIRYAFTTDTRKYFAAARILRLLWRITVLGVFASMLIKLLPQFWQNNLTDQMLMLPIALVFALLNRRHKTTG